MYANVLIKASINQPTEHGPPDVTGTLFATGASGVTGVQQGPLNSAGQPCLRSAGAPAPAGGQKSASVSTLVQRGAKKFFHV